MRYNGFTRIPHYLLDTPCGLKPAERSVLFCVYRLTAGYGRQSYRIKYSQLKEMTGIAGISRTVNSLAAKKMFELSDFKNGGSYIFTIPLPITSGQRPDDMRSTPPSHEVNGSASHDVNGYREAIDSTIDNSIDNSIEALTEKMKLKYPDKDIDKAISSFLTYPHHRGKKWSEAVLEDKVDKWCANEKPSHKKFIEQFKRDTCGFPMGWCEKCNVSASYEENQLYGDSSCCNGKILPSKQVVNA